MDCLEGLKQLDDESIDLFITDPPYKLNKTTGSSTSSSKADRWQGNLKAGDKTANIVNVIKFSEWLPEIFRVLKENSHCYIWVNDKNLVDLCNEAEKVGFRLHNILVWKKNNCTPNRWYMQAYEMILFLKKGKAKSINNMGTKNILNIKNIIGNKTHPTEKPVELMEILVKNSSNEGDLVLDCFMGTGATGVACKNLNRDFIGIEIDENYFNIAKDRLKDKDGD